MRKRKKLSEKYGPWAVITDATTSLGAQFARQLAASGLSIVLISAQSSIEPAQTLSTEICTKHPIDTRLLCIDAAHSSASDAIISATGDIDVGLLVHTARVEQHGAMLLRPTSTHLAAIAVNCWLPTALTHHFARRFAARARGGVVFVGSVACHPVPWMATFSSTMAYTSALAYALREELRPLGVQVVCVEAGAVDAAALASAGAGLDLTRTGLAVGAARRCVDVALRALCRGRLRVTPGARNAFLMGVFRWMPMNVGVAMKGAVVARMMEEDARRYV